MSRTSSIEVLYKQGVALFDVSQYESAIDYFVKVMLLEPNYKDTVDYITQANNEIRKIEKAENKKRKDIEFKKRIKAPHNFLINYGRASVSIGI